MKDTVWMEEMSWPEIERALGSGTTTAIVTAGSIEQHGPHLPLVTDTLLSKVFAERLAQRIGNTLVAPVIRPGCSDHHMAFPGTISYPPSLLQEVVATYCRCLAHHGFKRLVLMATHGGNFHPVEEAARQVANELEGQGVQVIPLTNMTEFVAAFLSPLQEFGIVQEITVIQADITETSFVLATRPELVDMERAGRGFVGEFDPAALLAAGRAGGGLRRITPNGILGDARNANPEIGQRLIASVVEYLYQAYRQVTE